VPGTYCAGGGDTADKSLPNLFGFQKASVLKFG